MTVATATRKKRAGQRERCTKPVARRNAWRSRPRQWSKQPCRPALQHLPTTVRRHFKALPSYQQRSTQRPACITWRSRHDGQARHDATCGAWCAVSETPRHHRVVPAGERTPAHKTRQRAESDTRPTRLAGDTAGCATRPALLWRRRAPRAVCLLAVA